MYRSFTLALVGGYLIALGAAAEVVHWLELRLDLVTGLLVGPELSGKPFLGGKRAPPEKRLRGDDGGFGRCRGKAEVDGWAVLAVTDTGCGMPAKGQGTKMTVRLPVAPVDESEPFPQPCFADVAPSPGDKAAPPGSEEFDLADLRTKA